jgi:peptidoglycan/xylan/chitin deacetylase (PgdA/CDA1 family)
MVGTFIISLDSEGKWGMADKISHKHDCINQKSLFKAYGSLLKIFERHEIRATFAFVGAFTLTNNERMKFKDRFLDVSYNGQNWLKAFRAAVAENSEDGWFCPEAFESVKVAGHEVASHGFCHVPFDDPSTPKDALEADLDTAVVVAKEKGVALETFVFPRNRVRHTELLQDRGFIGYRGALTATNRLMSAGQEFNILSKSQCHAQISDTGDITEIPAAYFFNWRNGLRRLVPRSMTIARWKSIIEDAIMMDGVAHLSLHPHNIIDGPGTLDVLCDVLRLVAEFRDKGQLKIETQASYLRSRMGQR